MEESGDYYAYCCISSVNVLGHGNARLNNCPLVEVPTPHGRLIDAEKLFKKGINLDWSLQKWVSEVDIALMPTIIEAEEGEDA